MRSTGDYRDATPTEAAMRVLGVLGCSVTPIAVANPSISNRHNRD